MITKNLQNLYAVVPNHVKIIAVSKTHGIDKINEAYNVGHRYFGENKVQELIAKYPQLPSDIEWHMIGHLQTNKVKYIAPFVSLIQSVDSIKLLETIDKEGKKNNRIIPCLLQVHIAQEETKFGFNENELWQILNDETLNNYTHVSICGLMGIATFTDDKNQIKKEFRYLFNLFQQARKYVHAHKHSFTILSMGMSNDFEVAIEEGSNMIRIGSLIFGERHYK